jgi:hypothetical protein
VLRRRRRDEIHPRSIRWLSALKSRVIAPLTKQSQFDTLSYAFVAAARAEYAAIAIGRKVAIGSIAAGFA